MHPLVPKLSLETRIDAKFSFANYDNMFLRNGTTAILHRKGRRW
jgi:hypothetical protein